jgi:hypothetical protein
MVELLPNLPENIQERINDMPEYSYGCNRVIVTLDDGREISDVYVAWAKEVVRVGKSEKISFDPSRVVDVRNQP